VDPYAVLILGAIKAVGEAVAESFRYAQTEAGQASIKKALADSAAFEKALSDAGAKLLAFLKGDLLK
jgi:predicted polyphosphate/ATP-dependent NAD kinase